MFIQTNDRLINLENVSNINVIHEVNERFERYRIVFNLNYCIEMQINKYETKFISDYVYWDCNTIEELIQNVDYIQKMRYFKNNFIISSDDSTFINVHQISSV